MLSQTHQLIVIQATPFCNIDCRYCYLPDRLNKNCISSEILKCIFDCLRSSRVIKRPFTILWHAGEPLTAGVDFFRQSFELAKCVLAGPPPIDFCHCIQTNAVLINEDWVQLLRSYGVKIGVSIDGPPEIHDKARRFRSGRGTHSAVMKGISVLKKANYPFSVIAVITKASLSNPAGFFEFFCDLGPSQLGLNVEEHEGSNWLSSLAGDTRREIRSFYRELIRLNRKHNFPIRIREFQPFEGLLRGYPFSPSQIHECFRTNQPLDIISFDYTGNFSAFSPELIGTKDSSFSNFVFGNICRDSLDDIEHHEAFRRLQKQVENGVAACSDTCGYFKVCGGGQPANKYFETGRFDVTETLYCRTRTKALVDVVLDEVENSLVKEESHVGPA